MSNINVIDQQITEWRDEDWNEIADNLQQCKELTNLAEKTLNMQIMCYVLSPMNNSNY